MSDFLAGFSVSTFLAAALFFLKFWRSSRDRFFLLFSVACVLIALDWFVELFKPEAQGEIVSAAEAASWVFLIRLVAFLVIAVAIVDKNRASKSP